MTLTHRSAALAALFLLTACAVEGGLPEPTGNGDASEEHRGAAESGGGPAPSPGWRGSDAVASAAAGGSTSPAVNGAPEPAAIGMRVPAELAVASSIAPEPGAATEPACGCTRRSEGTPSRYCPWGSGASVQVTLAAGAGSTLELAGTPQSAASGVSARAEIPSQALSNATTIALTELREAPPASLIDDSPIYRLEPLDLRLTRPGQLTLPHSNVQGVQPARRVYYTPSLSEPFTPLDGSYSNAGFHQAPWSRGGYYLVAHRPEDAVCEDPSGPAPVVLNECPCTRRDQQQPDPSCPAGADYAMARTLGPTGGELEISGTAFTSGRISVIAKIPAAALRAPTDVVLTELSLPTPDGLVDYSPVFKLSPTSLVLEAPGEIRFPGANKASAQAPLAIYYARELGQPFTKLLDSYVNAGFYQATLTRGGYYVVGFPETLLPAQCR